MEWIGVDHSDMEGRGLTPTCYHEFSPGLGVDGTTRVSRAGTGGGEIPMGRELCSVVVTQ